MRQNVGFNNNLRILKGCFVISVCSDKTYQLFSIDRHISGLRTCAVHIIHLRLWSQQGAEPMWMLLFLMFLLFRQEQKSQDCRFHLFL